MRPMRSIKQKLNIDSRIRDESSVYSPVLIFTAVVVALFCGLAAFLLHLFVNVSGCLGGVNGCHDHILLDALKPLGISTSLYFIISCPLSGFICSLILYTPPCNSVTGICKGGGGGHTKILVASGAAASGWIAPIRILLASIYLGGGNPLGTEGPIIHLSVTLGTWLVGLTGKKRRKFFSMFAVIGAAAGISAGFNVLVSGFVYVIEELTRTLSRKLALILALGAAMAILFADYFEKLLHLFVHPHHPYLVPEHSTWARLSDRDIEVGLALSIPIGFISGVSGWIFVHCAWALLRFLNPGKDTMRPAWFYWLLPQRSHLAIVGLICGCLGAIGYEATGMNGVWGTTVGAIPEAIKKKLGWADVLLLFVLKFAAFILATAASGPGGLLVPSFATGGLMAIAIGRLVGASDDLCAACAVMGMSSMFASVMHMPLTGVIIIFELTRADNLMMHVVIANFIASNIVARLPHGEHSFVHRCLEADPTWHKLKERDFIETDDHEKDADLALFVQCVLLTDDDRVKITFERWVALIQLDHAVINALNQAELRGSTRVSTLGGRHVHKSRTALCVSLHAPVSDSDLHEILPSPHSIHSSRSSELFRESFSVHSRVSSQHIRGSACSGMDVSETLTSSSSMNPAMPGVIEDEVINLDVEAGPEVRTTSSGRLHLIADSRGSLTSSQSCSLEEVAQRRQVRDQWTRVAAVIPDLNMRVWHALSAQQKASLASVVDMMAMKSPHADDTPKKFLSPMPSHNSIDFIRRMTPDPDAEPKTFMTPKHSPHSGKLLGGATTDVVQVNLDLGPAPTHANGAAPPDEDILLTDVV